eukprot:826684-Lingulodinium_polyedra.AAC.1
MIEVVVWLRSYVLTEVECDDDVMLVTDYISVKGVMDGKFIAVRNSNMVQFLCILTVTFRAMWR